MSRTPRLSSNNSQNFLKDCARVFKHVVQLIEGESHVERRKIFTQKLLNRLLCLAFLQKQGWLKFGSETDYLTALWKDYKLRRSPHENFYQDYLRPLFLALSSNADVRPDCAWQSLKPLAGTVPRPGLQFFADDESHSQIHVPDAAFESLLALFERYDFTTVECAAFDSNAAIDPEMLGQVFESFTSGRKSSGCYYTPKSIVAFMCREALKLYLGGHESLVGEKDASDLSALDARKLLSKLKRVRIIDPACGGGAYLWGMLQELSALIELLEKRTGIGAAHSAQARKLSIIEQNLFGVERDASALEIARLRLWLALIAGAEDEMMPPPPRLQSNIKCGDSLRAHFHESDELSATAFNWRTEFPEIFAIGGFDIALSNPPYGTRAEDSLRDLYFDRRTGGAQSKEIYGLFIACGLRILRARGHLSYLVSDTWRTIKSHRPLRRRLLAETTVRQVIDLPAWIFDATVNTSILTLTKAEPLGDESLLSANLRSLPQGDWKKLAESLHCAVRTNGSSPSLDCFARFEYAQKLIESYGNLSFFIGSPRLYSLMSDARFVRLGDVASVRQGLATADNRFFLRKLEGARGRYALLNPDELLTDDEICSLSEEEKICGVNPAHYGGRRFVPYDKGGQSRAEDGWLPNYYVPTQYFIDWSRGAVARLKTFTSARQNGKRAARFQNSDYYFRSGLTFSYTGFYAPNVRLSSGAVFDVGGSSCFDLKYPMLVALAFLASKLNRYLAKVFIDHTVNNQVDEIKELLLPKRINEDDAARLESLVSQIIEKQKAKPCYPYQLFEQKEIDGLVYKSFGLRKEDVREVELWFQRRYPKLSEAQRGQLSGQSLSLTYVREAWIKP